MTDAPTDHIILEEDKHWWFATRTKALLGILDRALPADVAGRRVLDVGCGAGNMFHHLARYGQVEGLDNNPKPLAVARQRGYKVQEGSASDMPFSAGQFDLVAALDVIEHVPDDAAVLAECYRVCRPAGFVIVTTPAFQWLWSQNDEINGHQRRYSRAGLRALLERAGFTVRRITYNNFAIFPMAAGLILLRRGAARAPKLAAPSTDDDAYQVEMEPAPPLLNALLTAVGSVEAWALRYINVPLGTQLIALAQKPAAQA
jgi:ubiquinone/menaquinone biosynthesis C-methylase UbiE